MRTYIIIYIEEKMIKSRTIFIWDVQWCYKELKLLIEKLKLEEIDRVFFVWDLINKWPKSYKVLNYVYKNRGQFRCIKWNCESNFLQYLNWNILKENKSLKRLKKKLEEKSATFLLDYIKSFPLYIEEKDFIVIHWWLIPNKKIINHSEEEITTTCEFHWEPWYNKYTWNKPVIYWHWAKDGLQIRNKTKWLDSWCVYWRALTAYILETWDIIQQNALSAYLSPYIEKKSILEQIKNIFNT